MIICLGENIRMLRTEKGLTQEQLGYELGVSGQAVSRWENGATYPDISMLPLIADYFSVSLDDLMGRGKELSAEERDAFFKKMDVVLFLCGCRHSPLVIPADLGLLAVKGDRVSDKHYSCARAFKGVKFYVA